MSESLPTTVFSEEGAPTELLEGTEVRKIRHGRRPIASVQMRRGDTGRYWGRDKRLARDLRSSGAAGKQVLHIHFGSDAARYLANLSPDTNRRVFVTFHGYDVDPLASVDPKYVSAVNDLLDRHRATALFVSRALSDRADELGLSVASSYVHYLGVNPAVIPARDIRATASPRIVVSVGALRSKKNHSQTIDAFAQLRARSSDPLELHIAGDGVLRAELEQQIRRSGLEETVFLHGWTTRQETFALLQRASCFVMASRGDTGDGREGLPIALLEALAVGLPAVGTTHSGIPEALQHAPQAELVGEGDATALASAIDRALAMAPSLDNRAFVFESFNSETQNAVLLDMYTDK